MGDAGGDVEDDIHIGVAGALGQAGGVVEEDFVRADLQEQRREACRVGVGCGRQQLLLGVRARA